MAKNEIGNGLAALLGATVPPAFTPPDVLPETPKVHVETPAEREGRQAGNLKAALEAMKEVLPEEPDFNTKLEALKEKLKAAQAEVQAANALVKEATAGLKRAQDNAAVIERALRALDTRTSAEVNKEYLDAQVNERFNKAKEQQDRLESAKRAGLITDAELAKLAPGLSPIDRAISERNQKARRAGYR